MRKARWFFVMLILCCLTISCSTPSQEAEVETSTPAKAPEEQVLTLWTHEFPTMTSGFLEKWIPEFEAAHPGVTVEYTTFPYSGSIISFDAKLLAEVASGAGPDVWAMASHNFTQTKYIESGYLAPLDPQFFGYESVDDLVADYPDNSLKVFIRDGEIYALLNELTTLCLFYNQDMFDEEGITYLDTEQPTSWTEIGKISQAFLEIDVDSGALLQMGYQFGFFEKYPSPEWYVQDFYPVMRQYGQDDVFVNGQAAGNGQAVVDTLQFFHDFTYKYQAYDPYFADDWFADFANGRVAMVVAGPWFPSAIRAQAPDVRFDVAPHPVVDPSDPGDYHDIMYSFGWVVNANSDPAKQELAQEFLAFILGKKGEAEQPLWWFENVGVMQPRTAFVESTGFADIIEQDPWMRCFVDTFDTYTVDYYQHSSDEAGAALVRAVNRVVYDGMSAEESADLLQKELLLLP